MLLKNPPSLILTSLMNIPKTVMNIARGIAHISHRITPTTAIGKN